MRQGLNQHLKQRKGFFLQRGFESQGLVVVRREEKTKHDHDARWFLVSSHTPQTRGGAGLLPALATLPGRNQGGDT